MANLNGPFGFRAVGHTMGACITASEYSIASGYTSSIFTGDLVILTGTSRQIAVSDDTTGTPDTTNVGVFAGCSYKDSSGDRKFSKYWPASTTATEIVAYVYDDPQIIFEAQCNTIAVTDLGMHADWVAGTGSTTTGKSAGQIDVTTGAATTGKQIELMRLVPRDDNAVGAYAKVLCKIVEHVRAAAVTGVDV